MFRYISETHLVRLVSPALVAILALMFYIQNLSIVIFFPLVLLFELDVLYLILERIRSYTFIDIQVACMCGYQSFAIIQKIYFRNPLRKSKRAASINRYLKLSIHTWLESYTLPKWLLNV